MTKRVWLFILCLVCLSGFGGCSEMSQDDREFYGRGWVNPKDLDAERPTKMPNHPQTTGSLDTARGEGGNSLPTNAQPDHDAQWGVPDAR